MDKPDVELEVTRGEDGTIVGMAYKVNKADEDRKNILEFCSLASEAFHAERLVEKEVTINADVKVG